MTTNVIGPRNVASPEMNFFTGECMGNCFRMAYRAFKKKLADPKIKRAMVMVGIPGSGKSVYCEENQCAEAAFFDAVSARPSARKALINMAKKAGKPIDAVWVVTPLKVCLRRNLLRDAKRIVPIRAMSRAHQLLTKNPPSVSEGFRRIIKIGAL